MTAITATSKMKGSPEERFWAKVRKTESCWVWTGSNNGKGYGRLYYEGRMQYAYRLSYSWFVGEIGEGLEIDHKCHNRSCVRPDHLRPVTHRQNHQNRSGPPSNNKSGVLGVSWHTKYGKWRAVIGQKHVGMYETVAEAEKAVIAARNKVFTHNDKDRT